MSNIKWIKLSTAMFDDEKIKLIEKLPEADTILIIWIKLLSQAGRTNANGYIYLNENVPYTEEMLATIFDRSLNTVRLALKTLKEFGMIHIDDDSFIRISNWEKHQNVEGMDRVRKLNAERNKRYRERKKQQLLEDKTDDVSVTSRDGTEEELERDKEQDIEIEQEQDKDVAQIIKFWDKNGFGVNNIHAKKQLLLWLDDSSFKDPSEVILKALNIACENDARRLKYTEGILRNWQNESLLTVEEIDKNHKNRNKQAVNQIDYDPNRDRF
ncbi:phage replisome organizer N-terminal domain-containing protein [Oceanobacillus alkalisoli]|uniref:phage replisome organizer N-terminal domain-containing protein n=1 Tax=Oceanobacillus alkalisoli TaxID=2925113 RepID=UPI001EE438BF|nr:phage replisome organizer N-terminal domain-containing protein [Oceanobacillus alkalisoli]MCG5104583.1 phage replisome organizer N-terminal domain-containing protein [Oceanobacillus alkalisoli]